MKRLFAVFRSRGPGWNDALPLEEQVDWPLHAAFMNALHDEGFVALGGPLGTSEAMLIIRAEHVDEIEQRLAGDPWSRQEILTISRIAPWKLLLGSLPS